jgi:hypothetical protein
LEEGYVIRKPFQTEETNTSQVSGDTAKNEMIWKLSGDRHHVVYTSPTTAWLFSKDLFGKFTASLYQTLTAGVHLGGTKIVRGHIETTKSKTQGQDMGKLKPTTVSAKKGGNEDENEKEQYRDDEDPARF